MKRELLIEERVKLDLGIKHTGCRSSFSSIVNKELVTFRQKRKEEDGIIAQRLARDKELRDAFNGPVPSTMNTTATFAHSQSIPSSASMSFLGDADYMEIVVRELQLEREHRRAENMALQAQLDTANQMLANQMQMSTAPISFQASTERVRTPSYDITEEQLEQMQALVARLNEPQQPTNTDEDNTNETGSKG